MLTNINGLENLADFPMQQLLEIAGIGVSKALQLGACFELIKRINIKSNQKKHIYFYNITDVVTFMKPYVSNLRVETFFLLLFNKHGKLIKFISLYVGTDSMIVIAPKEIFYHVIINKASKIACVHNHPNQNPFPSPNDEHITKQLKNIADIMHIG